VPFHLLFPLASSILFVLGMFFVRQGITRGASPWTGTFLANLWLALAWVGPGLIQANDLSWSAWWQACLIAMSFVLGQIFTYFAFQFGDVSVATPVFGVKVVIVAIVLSLLAGEDIQAGTWTGAVLAAAGVAFIQAGAAAGRQEKTFLRTLLTILLALLAAFSLSLFDTGLQVWGREHGPFAFLPAMFICTGLLSMGLVPWVDRIQTLRKQQAFRPVLCGTLLMALQAMSMSWVLSRYGDAARVNIVYALRGLWAVLLMWLLTRIPGRAGEELTGKVMLLRLLGAILLTASVVVALPGPI